VFAEACAAINILAGYRGPAHMWAMAGRPCNPNSDFKRLWQVFLRNAPLPQCEAPSDLESAEDSEAATVDPTAAKPATNGTFNR
jgi:hypothetical protein